MIIYCICCVSAGAILESKGCMWFFKKKREKCTKFGNILKKGSLMCATVTCMKELEYALKWFHIRVAEQIIDFAPNLELL